VEQLPDLEQHAAAVPELAGAIGEARTVRQSDELNDAWLEAYPRDADPVRSQR
jgi:hypothetical protein